MIDLDTAGGEERVGLHVLARNVYRGPHLFGRLAMIRIQIALGELEAWPTDRLPAFADRLLAALPGLARHGCSCPNEGGFPRRLREGTWLGHVIEHVALELQTLAGSAVSRGKTRSVRGRPGVYNILYRYLEEDVGLAAGAAAIALVAALLPVPYRRWEGGALLPAPVGSDGLDVGAAVEQLKALRKRSALGPTTTALAEAARRRTIPVARLDEQGLLVLGWGSRQQRLRASITGRTPQIAVSLAGNKDVTKALLAAAGLPVPKGIVVRTAEDALAAARKLGGPVVVKPLDGNHGRGVSTFVETPADIGTAFEHAAKISSRVIVEKHLPGNDHRMLVVDGKLVAVAERVPAHIVGDGIRSIGDLISIVNADPRRGDGHESTLTKIRVDAALMDVLGKQGRAIGSVPEAGEHVLLRGTANLSSGGTAIDRTDMVHPDNRLIAEMAARAVGLDIAGIDFLSPDIARSVNETGGGIVEVNAAPGFRMHLAPSEGPARDVAAPVIAMLYPPGTTSRIPVVAITGTNGKSTTARMVAAILRGVYPTVGLTTTSGVYVNDLLLKSGDSSGPKSARMLLHNPAVDIAVLETARGGILREGLGFDYATVGAVLNISEDHLGVGGVDTLDDLAAVKAVVVRSVPRRGFAVLNFDDRRVRALARRSRGRIIWFSRTGSVAHPVMAAHVAAGGRAILVEGHSGSASLVLYEGDRRTAIIAVSDMPASLGGAAGFNVENALAACAIATALGVAPDQIAGPLKRFTSNFKDNPGRFNIVDAHPFRVVIDYAHNIASMRALGQCLGSLKTGGGRSIGMVSMPGDRRDEDIMEMGATAVPMLDHIVFREGPDGRGRPRGEVLRLLEKGARSAGASAERISFVLEERDAVLATLRLARPGDLVVLFPTRVEEVHRQVMAFRPETLATASRETAHADG
ncbi:MAG: cyanophycin synthetase [Sphingobium sp.]|nr:cyanophycin synthetase [Sphingobium sp.]